MKPFVSDLQVLSGLYFRLHAEFSAHALEPGTPAQISTLSAAILQNRELLARIEQMNGRLLQLAQEWKSFREQLDPVSRSEVTQLAERVSHHASQLSEVCARRIQQLESGQNELQKAMDGVQTGARYLASIKPGKTNYPKFLDSLG
jgi:hypothetical protein